MATTGERNAEQRVEYLSLDDLQFDVRNPRLPRSVDGSDEAAVLAWMLVDEGLIELMGSIASQGYFPGEPVLVAPAEEGERKAPYVVVEGNRRLSAVKLLADPGSAPERRQAVERVAQEAEHRPTKLPAIVFDTRDEILDYLGYRHITGIKQWDPLAKARYVEQLVRRAEDRGEPLSKQQIARRIGSRVDYVDRLLGGVKVYDHIVERGFYSLADVSEASIDFSVLTTALSYEKIAGFVGTDEDPETGEEQELNDENLRDVVDWVFRRRENGTTVVGESRNLGQLAAVVSSPAAREALNEGTPLADAALLTDEPLESFRKAIRQATDKVKLARSMTHRVGTPAPSDQTALNDLAHMTRELAGIVRNLIEGDDPTL